MSGSPLGIGLLNPAAGMNRERLLRPAYLAAHIHEAPVWIVPCLEGDAPTHWSGSSIYPAVQNMLAARARPRRDAYDASFSVREGSGGLHSGCRRTSTPMPSCRLAIPWVG